MSQNPFDTEDTPPSTFEKRLYVVTAICLLALIVYALCTRPKIKHLDPGHRQLTNLTVKPFVIAGIATPLTTNQAIRLSQEQLSNFVTMFHAVPPVALAYTNQLYWTANGVALTRNPAWPTAPGNTGDWVWRHALPDTRYEYILYSNKVNRVVIGLEPGAGVHVFMRIPF